MSETPPATTSQDLQVSPIETQPGTPLCESDYEAIAAAVMETDRGRWFLQEYARRNRNSDTQTVLTAIEKLEKRISEDASTPKEATSVALLGHDLIDLAGAISQVKKEVADLGGQGDDPDHFNTATVELEAIVEQTESATSEILEAAEKIQEVTWLLREEGASETQCDIIESKIVEVYTACSFQDLTGQRSNKVVQLVGYVERRVASMMKILGLSDEAVAAAASDQPSGEKATESAPGLTPDQRNDTRPDADLLNGPALSGEGNEQGDVDALFGDQAFDSVVETDADGFASIDADTDPAEDGDSQDPTADQTDLADEVDLGQDSEPAEGDDAPELEAAAQEEDDLAFDTIDGPETSAETSEGDVSAAQEDEPEAIAEQAVGQQDAPETDFGEDEENPNTPEAADVFGFDVQSDPEFIELQDAEILSQSDEGEATSTPEEEAEQDIFEVDTLAFGGDAFGSSGDTELDSRLEAETDGAPKAVVGLPGDFDVDSHVADVLVSAGDQDTSDPAPTDAAADTGQEIIDGQDIFEADCVDVDVATDDPEEIDASEGGETLPDDIPAETVAHQDAAESATLDADLEASATEISAQEEPSQDVSSEEVSSQDVSSEALTLEDDALPADEEGQTESEPVRADAGTSNEGELDDQLAALDSPAASRGEQAGTASAQVAAAEELMEKVLAATSAESDVADYPDDDYTAEERIALFS